MGRERLLDIPLPCPVPRLGQPLLCSQFNQCNEGKGQEAMVLEFQQKEVLMKGGGGVRRIKEIHLIAQPLTTLFWE